MRFISITVALSTFLCGRCFAQSDNFFADLVKIAKGEPLPQLPQPTAQARAEAMSAEQTWPERIRCQDQRRR